MKSTEIFSPTFLKNRRILRLGLVAITLIVVITALVTTLYLHREAEANAALVSQNLAKSIEQTIEGRIASIDIALQMAADEIGRQTAAGSVDIPVTNRFIARQLQRLPSVSYMRASNEKGQVIYGTGIPLSGIDISDRAYFIKLGEADTLLNQHLFGRIANKWAWLFARRINKPDGSFGGVIFAGMTVEDIELMFSNLDLEFGGSIALRDADLGLIARHTVGTAVTLAPGDKQITTTFADIVKRHPQKGTYLTGKVGLEGVRFDGIGRTHSYTRSAKYGFMVNVGIAHQTALAEWRTQAEVVAGLVVAFILALLVFSRLLSRSWLEQERDLALVLAGQHALTQSEERFHSLFSAMSEGVALHKLVYDKDGRAVDYITQDINAAYERHTGLTRPHVLNQLASKVLGKGQAPNLEIYSKVAQTQEPIQFETFFEPLNKHFLINVFSPGPDQFATVFVDITPQKQLEKTLRDKETFITDVIDSLKDHVAVIDSQGQIITVNAAWRHFAASNGAMESTQTGLGLNYLDICARSSTASDDDIALQTLTGVKSVLAGTQPELTLTYPCHSPDEERWFELRALPLHGTQQGVLLIHQNISERKRLELVQAEATQELQARFKEITELQSQLQQQAIRDGLTNLYNRRYLDETLPRELARAQREGYPLSVVMLDLDFFKRVNDTYGHVAGDSVIKNLARILSTNSRESDIVCRYGGEEFLVVLPRMSLELALERVEKWRIEVGNTPVHYGDFVIKITISAGIAAFPDHGADTDLLVSQADQALYRSKQLGRNCVTAHARFSLTMA